MTAPEQRAGGLDSNARGIAVLVVAVLIGGLLLLKAGGGSSNEAVASSGPSTTVDVSGLETSTTLAGSDTTTTTNPASDGNQPSDVKVLVLNGSGKAGVAKTNSETIGQKGYTMLPPTNAAANASTTSVYYAPDYQADAAAIAALLGKTPDVVLPMPSTPLGAGAATANVVVVLGADTTAASGSTSSGSGTSTSTSTTSPN